MILPEGSNLPEGLFHQQDIEDFELIQDALFAYYRMLRWKIAKKGGSADAANKWKKRLSAGLPESMQEIKETYEAVSDLISRLREKGVRRKRIPGGVAITAHLRTMGNENKTLPWEEIVDLSVRDFDGFMVDKNQGRAQLSILCDLGLATSPSPGSYLVTERGLEVLKLGPHKIWRSTEKGVRVVKLTIQNNTITIPQRLFMGGEWVWTPDSCAIRLSDFVDRRPELCKGEVTDEGTEFLKRIS